MTNLNVVYPVTLSGEPAQVSAEDAQHFTNTINRALYLGSSESVKETTVLMGTRAVPLKTETGAVYSEGGWLEHAIIVKYFGGGQLVVGAIQRKPGNDSEFCS